MQTQAAAAPAPEPVALVTDVRAVDRPRTHDLYDRNTLKRYKFEPDKPLELPMRVAAVLIGNDGFRVETPDGTVLKNLETEVGGVKISLRSDQVIARFEELSKEALIARVKDGKGDLAKIGRTREDMVGWLIRQGTAERTADDVPEGTDLLEPDNDPYA